MTRHFILATAGHVDHGKSALVKALTGTDPDRLPQEKARGITIELGFAPLQLTSPGPPPTTLQVGIVDVPGHEDFVKTMVAGAGAIDLALLVVAADDGWMPQTEEHVQILTYLGVTRAVVALAKTDRLSPGEVPARLTALQTKLLDSPFANAPIVPTSVLTGSGLERLKRTLAEQLAGAPPPRDIAKPRLPIDRVFTLPGIGTVVTGTLIGGSLSTGQQVILQPSARTARIRSLQSHNRQLLSASPGMRTALNLADLSGPADSPPRRGQVVTLPQLGAAHDACEVLLERSPRLLAHSHHPVPPLKDGMPVRFHLGTAHVPGRLLLPEPKTLAPGQQCHARIRLAAPVFAFCGDRFVLRDPAQRLTLAGGLVLKPGFWPTRRPSPTLLAGQSASHATPAAALERELQHHRLLHRQNLLLQSHFSDAEVQQALAHLSADGKLVLLDNSVLETAAWNRLRERVSALVDAHHQAHPEQAGLLLAQLRSTLQRDLPGPELFDRLIADLAPHGFVQAGPLLKRASHRPALPPHLQSAANRIRTALALNPLEPPSRKELAPDPAAQQALRFLLQAGEVVELGQELVLASTHFARAANAIRLFLRQHGSGTVAELRQALGTTRRIALPLLEKLDRDGLTRRQGDKRVLKT